MRLKQQKRTHVGLQLNLVKLMKLMMKKGCVRLHSETTIKWPVEALWTALWEFAPFEMQIPHMELKEPEKQVCEEVCCREGGRLLNDNTGSIELLHVQSE